MAAPDLRTPPPSVSEGPRPPLSHGSEDLRTPPSSVSEGPRPPLAGRPRQGHASVTMDEGHSTFDHTGDLGLEVWAPSAARLYARAAEALMALVADARGAPPELELAVRLTGDDPADLFVHWLNTVLLESELAKAVWTGAEVHVLTPTSLEATLRGCRRDPARQTFLREIKAVSLHGLALELDGPICRCRLVLDI